MEGFPQVPDTHTFSLKDVVRAVSAGTPTLTYNLVDCFEHANPDYFDKLYEDVKNSLYDFRNYRYIFNIFFTIGKITHFLGNSEYYSKLLALDNDEYITDDGGLGLRIDGYSHYYFNRRPTSVLRDPINKHYIWIGLKGDVSYHDGALLSYNGLDERIDYLSQVRGNQVYCLLQDSVNVNKNMLVGTNNGFTLYQTLYESWTNFYIGNTNTGPLGSDIITSMAFNPNYDPGNPIPPFIAQHGALWVGTTNGITKIPIWQLYWNYTTWDLLQMGSANVSGDGLPSNKIECLAVGPDGDLWMGTNGSGICRIHDNLDGTFVATRYYANNPLFNTGLLANCPIVSNVIRTIAIEDNASYNIWIGTDNGISLLVASLLPSDAWVSYNTSDGFYSNDVRTIYIDPDNKKWVGQNRAISSIQDYGAEIRNWAVWNTYYDHDNRIHYDEEPTMVILMDRPNSTLYEGITIGTQTWMQYNYRRNIRYQFPLSPISYLYNNAESLRYNWGGLYNWNQIMTPGFCPTGWHVPSIAEWNVLINKYGGPLVAGAHLKSSQIVYDIDGQPEALYFRNGFASPNSGIDGEAADNSSKFSAFATGHYDTRSGTFDQWAYYANFWTSDEASSFAYYINMSYNSSITGVLLIDKYDYYLPVRLIKD
jgi:uncharacterized protein (TIGR02145 family)